VPGNTACTRKASAAICSTADHREVELQARACRTGTDEGDERGPTATSTPTRMRSRSFGARRLEQRTAETRARASARAPLRRPPMLMRQVQAGILPAHTIFFSMGRKV